MRQIVSNVEPSFHSTKDLFDLSPTRSYSLPLVSKEDRRTAFWKPFFKTLPGKRIASSVPLFYCQICLENHALSDAMTIQSCALNHQFCVQALIAYLAYQINEGVIILRCPCFGECNAQFSDIEVKNLVGDELYEKYERFAQVKNNPSYRECPFCTASTIGSQTTSEITCPKCSLSYCFFHANAHPDMNCSQYSRLQSRLQRRSVALINRTTRKCPKCQANTEKDGGCNHMTCRHCGEVS